MKMPNFLILGAAKAGTTSLYAYLNKHPEIYMSPLKETNFFALEGKKIDFCGPGDQDYINRLAVNNIEDYCALFQGVSNEIAVGEASPLYLYDPTAPKRIQRYIPDAKLIAILRNPSDRAYSSFLHLIRDGREPLKNFAQALQEEEVRISRNWEHIWHYKQLGFYYVQLNRYFNTFSKQQIRVYLFDDFITNPDSILKDIFQFLGVDDSFVPPDIFKRHNKSVVEQDKMSLTNKALHSFLIKDSLIKSIFKPLVPTRMYRRIKWNIIQDLEKPPLPAKVQKQLVEIYREDICKLEKLIQRNLSKWVK